MPFEISIVAHTLADDSTISDLEFKIAIRHIDHTLFVSERSGQPSSLDFHRLKRVLELAVEYRNRDVCGLPEDEPSRH